MTNQYDTHTTTAPGYAPYPPVSPYPFVEPPSPKELQRRALRKTSNGLGFFVMAYFLIMENLALLLVLGLRMTGSVTDKTETVFNFFLQIIVAVASSLVAVAFYKLFSHRRLSDFFSRSHVQTDMLLPLVMLGMGGAMLANQLASLFDSNISLFQLENTVSMTTQTQTVPEMILYIISTAVVPAFAEELAFRGVFMGILRKYGDAFAIIASSVMFGAMHGNTTQIVFAFILGLIFAYVDCKADSIVPSIIMHFTNNFYAVATDIISNNLGLDENATAVIQISIVAFFCALGILSYLYLINRDKNFFRLADGDKTAYTEECCLTLKEKCVACFTTAGVIISLSLFLLEMIINLIPQDTFSSLLS